jgi:hypothetical protein
MSENITAESLATQVRKVRNLQNKYFRTKDQKILRQAKACESELDKMVAIVLDHDLDTPR